MTPIDANFYKDTLIFPRKNLSDMKLQIKYPVSSTNEEKSETEGSYDDDSAEDCTYHPLLGDIPTEFDIFKKILSTLPIRKVTTQNDMVFIDLQKTNVGKKCPFQNKIHK